MTLASITNWDMVVWVALVGGGVCLEYFIGVARRIKPRNG